MEKQPHQEYRDNLADTVKGLPKEKRKEFLDEAKQTNEYNVSKWEHEDDVQNMYKLKEFEKLQSEYEKNNRERIIEIGGEKFELGPYLGELTWDEIQFKLDELNKNLSSGEKMWEVPNKEILDSIGKLILGGREISSLNEVEKKTSIEYAKSLGFFCPLGMDNFYWSSSDSDGGIDTHTTGLHTHDFSIGNSRKDIKHSVRCIRKV